MDTLTTMENFAKNFSNSINLLYVFLSAIAIGLTCFGIKLSKQIAKNYLKTKQVDLVCEIIEHLNKSKIKIDFITFHENGYSYAGAGYLFNIFELGNYDKRNDGSNIKYDNEIVLFKSTSNQLLDIKRYIDNPLTPKKLADELLIFYNRSASYIDDTDSNLFTQKFVLIDTGIWEANIISNPSHLKNNQLIKGDAGVFLSWLNLKEFSKNLNKIIEKWLIKNGIDENNIRIIDFKNIRPPLA